MVILNYDTLSQLTNSDIQELCEFYEDNIAYLSVVKQQVIFDCSLTTDSKILFSTLAAAISCKKHCILSDCCLLKKLRIDNVDNCVKQLVDNNYIIEKTLTNDCNKGAIRYYKILKGIM